METLDVASRERLWLRFFAGLLYLAGLSVWLSAAVEIDLVLAFAILLVGAVVSIGLVLTWLTLWARRADSQLGQFCIGSFFFLTALVAMLFGAVRWTAGRIVSHHQATEVGTAEFVLVTVAWLFAIAVSFPFFLGMAEAVIWAGVWALRQPFVRGAVRALWPKLVRASPGRPARRDVIAGVEQNAEPPH